MSWGRFVGIGVDVYDDGPPRLAYAVADIEGFRDLLGIDFDGEPLLNPDETAARDTLKRLKKSRDGGPVVLLWSGHGVSSATGLRLLARDSGEGDSDGLGVADVAAYCAVSGGNQLLLIVDSCFSGAAVPTATAVAGQILQKAPPDDPHVWVGVLASCLDVETARDGLLGRKLRALLQTGPDRPELRVRWSVHNEYLRGDDLCDAVLKEWGGAHQSPDFQARGSAWWMFRNPLYRPGAPEQVVEHLLLAARSGADADQRSWFTGRRAEVDQVVAWARSGEPGLHLVTGSAGTGKSAILGRVVSVANPTERQRMIDFGEVWQHDDPGDGAVAAHIHARGLTADRAAEMLAGQLVRHDILPAQEQRRNAAELVGQVQRAVESGMRPPTIVVDGLDEARGQAFTIATDLLARLARHASVIVGTRDLAGDDGPGLVATLAPQGSGIDLDDPAVRETGQRDIGDYVRTRLAEVDPAMDTGLVAEQVVGAGSVDAGRPFLLARLVTDRLQAVPIDTSQPGWETKVSSSIEEAFDADLARVTAPGSGRLPAGVPPSTVARRLLTMLTYGYGAGLPDDEWLALTNAGTPPAESVGRDELSWVLDELGRYVVQDGEAGVAVYRLAHQSLADHLRPAFQPSQDTPFDPHAEPIAVALVERYRTLLAGGVAATSPTYLWRYTWRHVADAGTPGLDLLRDLAAVEDTLAPDVALAAMEIASRLRYWGRPLGSIAPTEEAVAVYRRQADINPGYISDLAMTLNNLGLCYREVGRRDDAIPPTEEAVALYRQYAQSDPTLRSSLAMALSNLGLSYREIGRRDEAVAPAEEAVALYRQEADLDPTLRSSLAGALGNLGACRREIGRRDDAIAPTEEAVNLYREQADVNPVHLPSLAMTLSNLGLFYREVGRRDDAIAPTEEAVDLYRQQVATNPANVPYLAMALSNLGLFYREVGRRDDAIAPTEEAVDLYRQQSETNSAHIPNLAMALSNLGACYSEVGRRQDAIAPALEAVALYRQQSVTNPAYLPSLATVLSNLGAFYQEIGQRDNTIAPAEEAVSVYRQQAATNPAYLPDLAMTLTNLGLFYNEVGRHEDAVTSTEEAVALYRRAIANTAYLPSLATALSNLGLFYNEVGRRDDTIHLVEEAVVLYRQQAATNVAYLPSLAMALSNLGIFYGEANRPADAIALAEEATDLYRRQATTNAAYLPDLAMVLSNLGAFYREAGRHDDAVPLVEEGVTLYRQQSATNVAYLPSLAMALSNLGACYREVDRYRDAVTCVEEAIALYRRQATPATAGLTSLAAALTELDELSVRAGTPERGDAAWADVLANVEPGAAAYLMGARSSAAPVGHPEALDWLIRALPAAHDDRWLTHTLRQDTRRHRAADPLDFDRRWRDATGDLPAWLTADSDLVATAVGWIGTGTYADECAYLASHPELLAPGADVAVSEALLVVDESEAGRYASVRRDARDQGVEAAYRPKLLRILAQGFIDAGTDQQRVLLAERRDDLLTDIVRQHVTELTGTDQTGRATLADAILTLARAEARNHPDATGPADGPDAGSADRPATGVPDATGPADGSADRPASGVPDVEAALDALDGPIAFPDLLHGLAIRPDPAALRPTAVIAFTSAETETAAALAGFYLAVASALDDALGEATDTLMSVRRLDPAQTPDWINRTGRIGWHHPPVLALLTVLTAPLEPAPPSNSPSETMP